MNNQELRRQYYYSLTLSKEFEQLVKRSRRGEVILAQLYKL